MNDHNEIKPSGRRRLLRVAALLVVLTCPATLGVVRVLAQPRATAVTLPRFEVASVRPSPEGGRQVPTQQLWGDVTGRVSLQHISLKYLVMHAYSLQPYQLTGPAWLDTDFCDVFANVPAGTPKDRVPLMFQALLVERFSLAFHRTTKPAAVYALVVEKEGPRLAGALPQPPVGSPEPVPVVKTTDRGDGKSMTGAGAGAFGRFKMTLSAAGYHYQFESITLEGLARFLSQINIGLPVVDMTGLKGPYQVPLDVGISDIPHPTAELPTSQDSAEQPPSASDPYGVPTSVRVSLQKLGLMLERRRAGTEEFVIDHIARIPTAN
jgi:uncharacterized protein (TIGR03435 family)